MSRTVIGFRPQQGLLIMNGIKKVLSKNDSKGFRPQQGLTIINNKMSKLKEFVENKSFRPQQGLTIMNKTVRNLYAYLMNTKVSVPNRG